MKTIRKILGVIFAPVALIAGILIIIYVYFIDEKFCEEYNEESTDS